MFLKFTKAVATKSKLEKKEFEISIPLLYELIKLLLGRPYKLTLIAGLYG